LIAKGKEKESESEDVGSFGSCNTIIINSWHGVKKGSSSYV
jgi:hypothetical protein